MIKGQKASKDGIQYFLCPFTAMYITQGSNGGYSHRGIMANDVRGINVGERYPYYAPCDVKLLRVYRDTNTATWQSLNKVRFANGRIDYATFVTAHDNSFSKNIGDIVRQGELLGHMGDYSTKGDVTGVHCHIEISQSADTTWWKNQYGNYQFNNEYDTDECYFVNDTELLGGVGGNWKTIPKDEPKYIKYRGWVQDKKWTDWVGDGKWCGTKHESRRLEAIQIDPMGKDIYVSAQIQNDGWKDYGKITKDTIIGTQSQSKRLECLKIRIDDKTYNFQLHIEKYGDTCPTRCDGISTLGSVGQSLRVESFRIFKK